MLEFCVVGSPRSTTKWTATMLTLAGVPCVHEGAAGRWGPNYEDIGIWRESLTVGESTSSAVPFAAAMRREGVRVIQLIRDPLAVAASLVGTRLLDPTMPLPLHGFIRRHCPDALPRFATDGDRALRFWIEWNRLALESAHDIWEAPAAADDVHALAENLGLCLNPDRLEKALSLGRVNQKIRGRTATRSLKVSPSLRDEAMDFYRTLQQRITR